MVLYWKVVDIARIWPPITMWCYIYTWENISGDRCWYHGGQNLFLTAQYISAPKVQHDKDIYIQDQWFHQITGIDINLGRFLFTHERCVHLFPNFQHPHTRDNGACSDLSLTDIFICFTQVITNPIPKNFIMSRACANTIIMNHVAIYSLTGRDITCLPHFMHTT